MYQAGRAQYFKNNEEILKIQKDSGTSMAKYLPWKVVSRLGQRVIPEEALHEIEQQIAQMRSTVASLVRQNEQKDEEIERFHQILLNMQRARFGQKSEKHSYILDDGTEQLTLFAPAMAGAAGEPQAESVPQRDSTQVPVQRHTRKKKRTLEEMCASLLVEEHVVDLAEEEKQTRDGRPLICMGQEYVRTELVLERAKAKVV